MLINLKEIGLIPAVLLVLVIFGNLWFHFVESILGGIKRIFSRGKKQAAWHPLESGRTEAAEKEEREIPKKGE